MTEIPGHAPSMRVPTLDGARGLAAVLVVVGHCANEKMLPEYFSGGAGKMGVAIFFALSGFLMAHLYAESDFNLASVLSYCRRRIGRVAPLYYALVILSLIVPASTIWTFPIRGHVIEHFFLLRGQRTLWTIPVEMQFYGVFVFLWFAIQKGRAALAIVSVGLLGILSTILLRTFHVGADLLPFWIYLFLFGVSVALLWHRGGKNYSVPAWAGYVTMVVFFLSFPNFRERLGLPVLDPWWDPITMGGSLLFFLAALFGAGPLRHLKARPLAWLGSISYGIYLFHFPVLMTVLRLWRPAGSIEGALGFLLVFLITLALAEVSRRYFEAPVESLIRGKRRPKGNAVPLTGS